MMISAIEREEKLNESLSMVQEAREISRPSMVRAG